MTSAAPSSSRPRVTVLMPVYNAEAYLQEALDSISAQSFGDFELLAVDDGSTDGSPALLARHAARDARLVVLRQANGGVSAALNAGLAAARGDFIARMDADDRMAPVRLARQIAVLEADPALGFCASGLAMIDAHGRVFAQHLHGPTGLAELHAMLARRDPITFTHPTVMLRSAALHALGGAAYLRAFEPCEDMELFGRLILAGRPGLVIPESLLEYRVHGASISGSKIARQMLTQEFVRARFYAQRDGAPELTRSAWDAARAALPWRARLAAQARLHYDVARKQALYRRAEHRPLAALACLGRAAAWRPVHTVVALGRRLARGKPARLAGA